MAYDFMQREIRRAATLATGGELSPFEVKQHDMPTANELSGARFPEFSVQSWKRRQWDMFVSQMSAMQRQVHTYHQNLESPAGKYFKTRNNLPYNEHSTANSIAAAVFSIGRKLMSNIGKSAMQGAEIGGAVGSVVPGVGTAVGTAAGMLSGIQFGALRHALSTTKELLADSIGSGSLGFASKNKLLPTYTKVLGQPIKLPNVNVAAKTPSDITGKLFGNADTAVIQESSDTLMQSLHNTQKTSAPNLTTSKKEASFLPARYSVNTKNVGLPLSRDRVDSIYANEFTKGIAY